MTPKTAHPTDARGEEKAKHTPKPHRDPHAYLLAEIPTDSIDTEAQTIRHDQNDDDVVELALDIEAHGLLQPIGVRDTGHGRHQLLWGARRLTAVRRLGRAHIAAHIYDAGSQPTRAVALRENILRRPMTLSEECDAVSHLHHEQNLSPDQISCLISKSRAWVLRRLAVQSLPADLRAPLLDGVLSIGAAEALARLADDGLRRWAAQQTIQSELGITQVRALVSNLEAAPNLEEAIAAGANAAQHAPIETETRVKCHACGSLQLAHELITIRVCAAGCTVNKTNGHGERENGSTADDPTPHAG